MKSKFSILCDTLIAIASGYSLLLCCSTAYAASIDESYVAEQISTLFKTQAAAATTAGPAQRDPLIQSSVIDTLKKMKVSDTTTNSIVENLKTALPAQINISEIEKDAGVIEALILSGLKQQSDQNAQSINEIKLRIENLEAVKKPKMLSPHKDVDFLFETVLGDVFDATKNEKLWLKEDGKKIKRIEITRNIFSPNDLTVSYENGDEKKFTESASPEIDAKMQAVEKTLGIQPPSNADLISRINSAYSKVNNTDWQNDDLRFGVLVACLPSGNIWTTSIALHAYPAYRRFSPGAPRSMADFGRRLSLFFAVGSGRSPDNSTTIQDPIYTLGIGVDIVKGLSASIGISQVTIKDVNSQALNTDRRATVGVTLNSDLWKSLFNTK